MARRFLLAAVVAVIAAAFPASSFAVTAASAPTLTSALYTEPGTISWTPAAAALDAPTGQQVFRSDGACTPTTTAAGTNVTPAPGTYDMTVNSYSTASGANPLDGTYCFHIRTIGTLLTTSDGPGLTVVFDTTSPSGTVAITPAPRAGIVTGTVKVTGTSSDATSGVDSSTFHVGAVNSCASGAVIPATWDTTTVDNGIYQVCNVVIDRAGHVTTAALIVTIANAAPPVVPVPAPGQPSSPSAPVVTPPPVIANPAADPTAPDSPTKVTYALPKAKSGAGLVTVKLRWVKPVAADLAKVVVVFNARRVPRKPSDGTKLYSGLGTSTSLDLKVGGSGYVALYAYDTSGNISSPAQKLISLAPLIPLRPTSGSSVDDATPRLTWKAKTSTAYYNVQLYRNGVRVLTGWPTKASYRIPAGKLTKGTYVWFVWPAVKHGSGTPTFGQLIGRATFKYTGA